MDYFGARYYASAQGRFTIADPLFASGRPNNPQSWNRYSYVLNRPLSLIDPDGLKDEDPGEKQQKQQKTVYVFVTFTPDEQRTSAPVRSGSGTQTVNIPAPNFQTLDDKAPAGIDVRLVTGANVTESAVNNALQDANAAAVVFIGHAAGTQDAASGVYSARGITLGNGREFRPDGTPAQVGAGTVCVFACDSKSVKGDFALGSGQSYIGVDSGQDGFTSTAALSRAGFSTAQALIAGRSPDAAVAAANGALTPRTTDKTPDGGDIRLTRAVIDQGDKVQRIR